MQQDMFQISYTFRGNVFSASFQESDPTVGELGRSIQSACGTSYDTLKILGAGLKGALHVASNEGETCSASGLVRGKQYMVLGSSQSDIQKVREAKELPGLLGFDGEVKRAAMRRRTRANSNIKPAGGEFSFGNYKVLNLPMATPPPSEALKVLHRLAADPGIVGIMNERRWKVGLLSEMPPEGRVGVSEVCVLGYNVNKGQEIALRLRTDDLKGLRKYRSIRDTLVHELTHMVWSDHDINFKMLNSELAKDCERLNAQSVAGSVLGGDFLGRQSSDEMDVDLHAETPSDGHMLGGKAAGLNPSLAARGAALKRMADSLAGTEKAELVKSEMEEGGRDLSGSLHGTTAFAGRDGGNQDEGNVGPSDVDVEPVVADAALSLSDSPKSSNAYPTPEPSLRMTDQQSSRSSGSDAHLPGMFPENDPAVEKVRRAENAVEQLQITAPSEALVALQTLEKVFKNTLEFPGVEKYLALRMGNRGFHTRVGRHRHAVELMKLVGFVEEGDPWNSVLRLKRQDPGLLWLGLSVVKQGIQRYS